MFEKCLYFNGNALLRQLNRIWDEAYAESGLSAPHAYLLRMVCHQPGLSQKQIAAELQLEKSTVTRFVKVLLEKKLICRRKIDDGRENRLVPSESGKRLGQQLDRIGNALYSKMRNKLGPEPFSALVEDMRDALIQLS